MYQELDLNAAIFDAIDTLVVILDSQGAITRCNQAWEELTGLKFEEVKNRSFWNSFPQPKSKAVEATVRKVQSDKLPSSQENTWELKDGSHRYIRWSYTPFLEPSGAVKSIICTGSDITAAKRLEEECSKADAACRETAMLQEQKKVVQERVAELAKANDALKQSLDVLAAEPDLDKFLGHVLTAIAHQFQSPIVEYWYHPEGNVAYIGMMSWQGCILDRNGISQVFPTHAGLNGFEVPPELIGGESLQRRKQYLIYEDHKTNPFTKHLDWVANWLVPQGLRKEINIPMTLGGNCIGALIIRLPYERQIAFGQIELAQALAHQATLAVQLTRLAEQSRSSAIQNAVLKEREQAAQQRAVELEVRVKERTAELAQANALLDTLLETAPIGFALFDLNQRYVHINTALAKINGVPASDHIGRTVLEVLPHMSQEVVKDLQHVAQTDEPVLNREVIGETPAALGEQRHWLVSYYPVRDREQHSVGIGAVVVEITERKRAEAALHRLRDELEQRVQERTRELATTVETLHKEVAERQRAEQLARGQTAALSQSLTVLAAQPVLDNFLGYVLQAIAEQLDSPSGGVWLYDETYNTTVLHINYENGEIQRGEEITRPGSIHNVTSKWDTEYIKLLRQESILIQDVRQLPDIPEYAPYHANNQQQGIKMILVIPLFFGETFLGNVTLRSTQPRDYKPEELELARVLAYQATLAIQLTHLAKQSQQAAVLEERNRIIREIHDTLAQAFTGIGMQLEAATRFLTTKPAQAHFCIARAHELARSGLADARRSVWALQPESAHYRDLFATLTRIAKQVTADTSVQAEVCVRGTPRALPPDIGMNLLRIGQEALTNALRHAQAQNVQIIITYEAHQIQLSVEDDGQGFDLQYSSATGGFGLISMQQRAKHMGSELVVMSQPGCGTQVTVAVPMERT